jgi:hypothetical protein
MLRGGRATLTMRAHRICLQGSSHHRIDNLVLGRRRLFRWPGRQRLPAGDDTGPVPCFGVVEDAREDPAQLDGGRELASLIEGSADRCSLGFGDAEHRASMSRLHGEGQAEPAW